MNGMGVVLRKLPPREMACQHFQEIFPIENNHVYSNRKTNVIPHQF